VGVVDPGEKNVHFFPANCQNILIFQGKNFDFSKQIDEKFRFLRQLDEKFQFFSGKNFRMTFFSHLLQCPLIQANFSIYS